MFSPHLCVGFLFLVVHSRLPPPPPAASLRPNLLTHNLLTPNLITHTQLTHTQLVHIQLVQTLSTHNLLTHNLLTPNLFTHNLSTHSLFTHNLFTHNLLTHNLFTHNLLTCPHTTRSHTHTTCPHTACSHTTCSHTTCPHTACSHTQLAHTQLVHTQLVHTQLTHTQVAHIAWHLATSTSVAGVAGVALPDMDLHFAWQAWHLWRWAACGGTLGSRLTPLSPRLLAWQAWNLRHRPSLPVAGVALGDIHAASESISLKYDFVTHNFVTHNSFTHKFIQLCHRQSFTHTQLCHTQPFTYKWSILHHLLCPFFFLRAASTTFSDCWKKLTCGVIRSFNFNDMLIFIFPRSCRSFRSSCFSQVSFPSRVAKTR